MARRAYERTLRSWLSETMSWFVGSATVNERRKNSFVHSASCSKRTPAGVPGLRARCRRWTDGEGHLFEDLAVDGRPHDVTVSGLER